MDRSENMIEEAKQKYPALDFQVKDALQLKDEAEFDAVFSNATLHWIKDPGRVLNGMYQCLKPRGRLVAEFGGYGNVKRITDELFHQFKLHHVAYQEEQFPWYFPSIGEYTTLMEKVGFRVTLAQHYDRPTPLVGDDGLRNWIEMFGQSLFPGVPREVKEAIIIDVQHQLKETLYIEGTWMADYKRIRVVGVKE